MKSYPLATMIIQQLEAPLVTQVPLIYRASGDGTGVLIGHVDRNNPMSELIISGTEVYCLFTGPNGYITPSIYPDEHYPGWNYVSVHVRGDMIAMESLEEVSDMLIEMAQTHELPDSGYQLTPDQNNYEKLLNYILGFRVTIIDAKAVIKLSQDKSNAHAKMARRHLAVISRQDPAPFLKKMLRTD